MEDREKRIGVVNVNGCGKVVNTLQLLGYQANTDVVVQYVYHTDPPKDNPITVKGNSRQEVVQGKRHSWPVSKKRKGHR